MTAPPGRPTLPRLRPYQAAVARAILRRALGDGADGGGSLSVEIARQGGKNELSAQVELALLLARARSGGAVVKCAPTLGQARISQRRLSQRVTDAGLGGAFEASGAVVRCGAAQAHFLSAAPAANVVGHTADLLLEVDEAQDVEPEKFDRDFRPMAASTDAPVIYYGTPWGPRSLLEQAKATHRSAERRDGRRRHFRYDWEHVARYVPRYARYVAAERERLGERHPLFRSQYLLEPVEQGDRLFDAAALAQLDGSHARLSAPRSGERYVAGLDLAGPAPAGTNTVRVDRDWTVLTIARVQAPPAQGQRRTAPAVEVVEHQAWQGEATERLLDVLADRLRRVWAVRRLAVDATGLGGPMADLLDARLPRNVVAPVVFSSERKSRLGFALLAAVLTGRLRLYRADGSAQRAQCRSELELARVAYRDARTMEFDIDPRDGHDDYLMSLALTVEAAAHPSAQRDRTARGRDARPPGTPNTADTPAEGTS